MEPSLDYESLAENEKRKVDEYVSKLKWDSPMDVLQFGIKSQSKLSKYSDVMIENIQSSCQNDVSEILGKLEKQIKLFYQETQESKKKTWNKRNQKQMETFFGKIERQIESIEKELKAKHIQMLKESELLSKLYQNYLEDFHEISFDIIAGEKKLNILKEESAKRLQENQESIEKQRMQDVKEQMTRLEKRIFDLKATRVICMQMIPHIKLLQKYHVSLAEKIQTILSGTLALWKKEMASILDVSRIEKAEMNTSTIDMVQEKNETTLDAIQELMLWQEKETEKRLKLKDEVQTIEIELKNE